ncbi:MAG: hypothetical protein KAT71_08325 [Gammaproteobacteria bacterium]|nr:hypothetical protein [Gammaproteobacteria bacterium]
MTGTFAGGVPSEMGAWISQALSEKGYDLTDKEQVVSALRDTKLMSEIKAEAFRKGITTAGVDALFGLVGGKVLGKAAKKTGAKAVGQVIARGAKELAVEATGEAVGEFAGQAAARKSFTKVNLGEAISEGVISLGQSAGQAIIKNSIRNKYSDSVVGAAKEMSKDYFKANETIEQMDAVQEINETMKESKTAQRDAELMGEFVEHNISDEPKSIFFQNDDWDEYWSDRGESPADKAAELFGDNGEKYHEAKNSGAPLEVPLKNWTEKLAATEDAETLSMLGTMEPNGMTIAEADEVIKAMPATMEELAQEAVVEKSRVAQRDLELKDIKTRIEAELVAIGRDPKEAILLSEFYKAQSERTGVSPKEIASRFGLTISRESDVGDGTVLSQGDIKIRKTDALSIVDLAIKNELPLLGSGVETNVYDAGEYVVKKFKKKDYIVGLGVKKRFLIESVLEDNNLSPKQLRVETNSGDIVLLQKKQKTLNQYIKENLDTQSSSAIDSFLDKEGITKKIEALDESIRDLGIVPLDMSKENLSYENGEVKVIDAGVFKLGEQRSKELINRKIEVIERQKAELSRLFSIVKKSLSEDKEKLLVAQNRFDKKIEKFNSEIKKMESLTPIIGLTKKERQSFKDKIIIEGKKQKELFQGQKGQIKFGNDKFNITLFETADASTLFHELGHYFLEVFNTMAKEDNSNLSLQQDANEILKFLGVKSFDAIKTEHHEKFARGFEQYIREGKAPTRRLKKVFNQFKLWMISVYKRAEDLDVKINDNIRGVFDRLLATEQEISDVKNELQDAPLLDPTNDGMPGPLAAKYKNITDDAYLDSTEKLNVKMMKDLDKKRSKAYRAERKKTKESVNKELMDDQLYNARNVLLKGVMLDGSPIPNGVEPFKLDTQALEDALGKELVSKKFRGMKKKNGMPLEIASQILGFADKQAMLDQIKTSGPFSEFVNFVTDIQMEKKHPTLINQKEVSEFAATFYHNDKRADRLKMELDYMVSNEFATFKNLTKKIAKRVPPNSKVRLAAKDAVGKIKTKDLRPNDYKKAERTAANRAAEFWGKGDWEKAFDQKQKELFNHYLFLEGSQAKEKIDKSLKDYKKFFRKDEDLAKTRELNFINAARAILEQYDIGDSRATQKKPALEYLKTMAQYDEDGFKAVVALAEHIMQEQKPFSELTYAQSQELNEGIQALWDLAKSSKEVEVGGKKILISDAVELLNADMERFKKPKVKKKYNSTKTFWEKTKVSLLGVKALGRRLEHWIDVMDNGDISGNFRKFMFQEISDATDRFMLEKVEYTKRFIEESNKVNFDPEKIQSDELGFEFQNKAELLGALLHVGNDSNKRKLLVGYGWADLLEDGSIDSSRWDKFLKRMHAEGKLVKADWDYVQSLWDMMEEIKPMAQKAHKKLFGYYFNEITHQEIVTPFGTYKGGYAPAKTDPNQVTDIARKNELEEFVKGHSAYDYPAAGGKGFTISRVDAFNRPLLLDVKLFNRHMDDTLRFAIVKPTVVDAAKVVTNKEFRESMDDIDPIVISEMIKPALSRADKNSSQATPGTGPAYINKGANYLRKTSAMQIMFANTVNTIEQFTGLSIALVKVSPRQMFKSLYRYTRNPRELTRDISEKSEYMNVRFDNQIFELANEAEKVIVGAGKYDQMKEFAQKNAYIMQQITQNIVDAMVWDGSYNDSVEKGLSEVQAVKKADADVRLTQSSARALDVSNMEANTYIRFFQMFMSYFNMVANVNASEMTKIYYSDLGQKQKMQNGFMVYMYAFAIPAILSAALRKAAGGTLDENDDDEIIDDLMDVFFTSQVRLATAMVPVLGSAVQAGFNKFNDKFYDDRVSASPAITAISSVVGAPVSVGKAVVTGKNKKGATRDALTAVGVLLGLPIGVFSKPIGYALDVSEGKAQPTGPIDAARGYVTGRSR